MKRVLILSDTHCGHNLGLTPPRHFNYFKEIQKIGWDFFKENIKKLGKIDLCILGGDLVDGNGKKDTLQHNTTNISEQQKIAIECLEIIPTKKFVFFRGTPYHTTDSNMESEDAIAEYFNSSIYDSKKIDVEGCILHCRHTTGKGGTPYGSITSLQRSSVVQILNDIESGGVKADIFIRSHIHEYCYLERELYSAITTPALQFAGSTYGRKITGTYSYGIAWIDVKNKVDYSVNKILLSENKHGSKVREEVIKI